MIVRATYWLKTPALKDALTAFTRGQSVGNPSYLSPYETRYFLKKWCASSYVESTHRLEDGEGYVVRIDWPSKNFGREGLNYFLSVLMGGQCDVDLITQCRLIELAVPSAITRHWSFPRFGIAGLRKFLNVPTRALCCGIIKPKIGLTPLQLGEVVKQLIAGGCDVIKEDEILADQVWCPMGKRLKIITKILDRNPVLYLACVTGDGSEVWKKARMAEQLHPQIGVHCNLWASLGTYHDLRRHVRCPIFFQKSGDKVWTTGPFAIDYSVLCQLLHYAGCDIAHVGMYGGYLSESVETLQRRIQALRTTLPSFSCGMTPALAEQIIQRFGKNVLITAGGWLQSHPEGIETAVRMLRRAMDGTHSFSHV